MPEYEINQPLMDFVVKIAANDTFRSEYEQADEAGRRAMMIAAELDEEAIAALEAQNETAVEDMLNKQVATGGGKQS